MSRHARALAWGALAIALSVTGASAQSFIYVQPGAAGNGSCATPFGTIAAAVDAARMSPGADEIRIAAGTYGENSMVIDFSNVTIKGGYPVNFGGCPGDAAVEALRNVATNVTTINGANTGRHFSILPQIDDGGTPMDPSDDCFVDMNTNIAIDGITFVNGRPGMAGAGGSILMLNTQVAISNSTFDNNTSASHFFGGGAIYMAGYAVYDCGMTVVKNAASLDLTGNLFENNQTGRNPAGGAPNGSGFGGAIFAFDANALTGDLARLTVVNATDNVFRGNIANGSDDNLDPAVHCQDDMGNPAPNLDCNGDGMAEVCASRSVAGAVFLNNIQGEWTGNTFEQNTALAFQQAWVDASGQGGAMAIFSSTGLAAANPNLTNNTFRNNVADAGRGNAAPSANPLCGYFSAWGGALYMAYFAGDFTGNVVEGNTATAANNSAPQGGWGGGIFLIPQTLNPGQDPFFDGNTISNNSAIGAGGRLHGWGGGIMTNEFGLPASPIITNNVVTGNSVSGGAGGTAYGGGLFVTASGPYTLVAGNVIEGNFATGRAGSFSGIGAGIRTQLSNRDQLLADNRILANEASEIDPVNFPIAFSGAALLASALEDTLAQPTLQNNLFAENVGIGLTLIGFPDYDAMGMPNGDFAFSTPGFVNNTLARNTQPGLAMNASDDLVIDTSIIWGNDTGGSGLGDIFDEFLADSRPSANITVTHSIIGTLPMTEPASLIASANDPANNNLIGVDPLFVAGPLGGYYLRQPPDQPAPVSPAVDAGPVPAAARTFGTGLAPLYMGETMAGRTTRSVSQTADLCFIDIGFHYPLGAPAIDADGDTVPDADETVLGTDPMDADTDNDGLIDSVDCGPDLDGDGTNAALDCDTDGDGLTDGLESGVTMPHADTDVTDTCDTSNASCGSPTQATFTPDADNMTRTDYLDPDTDGLGENDGCEDVNKNGRFNAGMERDPNNGSDDDQDRDGFPSSLETNLGIGDPNDADTDDDGVADGAEVDLLNFEFSSEPLNCDTDGDTILDGVERSTGPVPDPDGPLFPLRGTDVPRRALPIVTCVVGTDFAPDAETPHAAATDCNGDGDTADFEFGEAAGARCRTWTYCDTPGACEGADTDGDGCPDGQEDANQNGAIDAGESDPGDMLDTTCAAAGGVWVDDRSITALSGGPARACGPQTTIPEDDVFTTPCNMPIYGCDPARALGTVAAGQVTAYGTLPLAVSGTLTIPGAAAEAFEPARLTVFEVEGCSMIFIEKRGTAIDIRVQ